MINKLKLYDLKQIIIEYLRLVFRKFNLDVRSIDANQKKLIYKFLLKIFIIDSGHKLRKKIIDERISIAGDIDFDFKKIK